MTKDFATAMRRALEKTRAADPGAATAIIQAALSGSARADEDDIPCPPWGAPPKAHTSEGIDLSALAGLRPGGLQLPGFSHPAPLVRRRSPKRAPVPDGARVELRHYTGHAGSRSYRLFVPSERPDRLRGLVLMLHGCTQSPEDFALGTGMDLAAEREGFVIAYPAQTGRDNPQSCWNWFRPGDQKRGDGEPAILAGLATGLGIEFGLERRIHAAGLSAGGAMAAILGDTYPEVFTAIGVHSGLAAGSACDVASAFGSMRGDGVQGHMPKVPAIVFHGTSDSTVSPRNARLLVPGNGVETRESGGGRRWSRLTTDAGSELWLVDGAGHAWFGGNADGSYADPAGPDASSEMLHFFKKQGTSS